MKKNALTRLLAMLLTVALLLSIAGCGNNTGSSDSSSSTGESTASAESTATIDEEPYHIVMAYVGNEQPDSARIVEKINEITKEELNMTFETIQLNFGDYQQKLNLMLSGGDELDILPVFYSQASSYINAGQIVNLNDYIHEYGKDILSQVGEDIATSGSINGFVYGTPAQKESASRSGIVMRKDIVDECGIDVDAINTMDDLTEVFAKVKEKYPNIDCIAGVNLARQSEEHDTLFDRFGVLMNNGQDTTVTNWFETDNYKTKVNRIHQWYKDGYIMLDSATTTESSANMVKAGTLFSYLSPIKPGFIAQANSQCATEMVTAYISNDAGEPVNNLFTNSVNFFNWGIATNSKDKVKAMQFLNFAYSSPEFNNLMNFGEEGVDYVKVDGSETLINFPDGIDATTTAYHLNIGWQLPNQFLGYVWEGQPEDVWQQYKEFNDSALKSKAFGFIYDSSSVATELTALASVQEEYYKALETGSVSDVDATIDAFNKKLYDAGLQKVMDLKQTQLDAWLASK